MKGALKALLFIGMMAMMTSGQLVNCKTKINHKSKKVAYEYDLTPIYHSQITFDLLTYFSAETQNTYTMNVCGESASSCSTGKAASVCCFLSTGSAVSLGLTETQEFQPIDESKVEPGKGVALKYSQGSMCPTGGYRKSTIEVHCNNDSPYVYTADEDSEDACDVTFYVYADAGCGTPAKYTGGGGGLGAGGIILIM